MSRCIVITLDDNGNLNSAFLETSNKSISLEGYLIRVNRILNSFENVKFQKTGFNEFTITDRKVINTLISKVPNLNKSKQNCLKKVIISASLLSMLTGVALKKNKVSAVSSEKTKEDSNNITFEIDTEKYKPDFLVNYEEKNNVSLTNLKNEKLSQDIPINENTFDKDELTEDIPVALEEANVDLSLTQDAPAINTDNVIIDEEYLYEDDKPVYSFDYEDRSNSEKSNYAKENYTDLVNKYATTYGLDSKLVMAILTQENAYNEINNSNIGANGVMQIESIWNGYEISAYNYETGNVDKERIDSSSLANPEYAIKIGCMILNNQYMTLYNKYYLNGNITKDEVIIATVISYNKGITAICNLINNYGKDFTSHISETFGGDNDYLKHVFSYLEDMSIIKIQNQNDTPSEVVIDNLTL